MTKASDNEFPSLLIKEGTAPSSPAAGDQRLYIDSSDHKVKRKNSSGTVTTVEGLSDQGTATYLDFTTATAPANPSAGAIRVYSKTGDTLAQRTSAGVETVFGAGGGGSVTISSAQQTADDTKTAGAGYGNITGLSLSLASGTYLILAALAPRAGGTGDAAGEIRNSTDSTTLATANVSLPGTNYQGCISLMTTVVLSGTKTILVRGAAIGQNMTFMQANNSAADGNLSGWLLALKIA